MIEYVESLFNLTLMIDKSNASSPDEPVGANVGAVVGERVVVGSGVGIPEQTNVNLCCIVSELSSHHNDSDSILISSYIIN